LVTGGRLNIPAEIARPSGLTLPGHRKQGNDEREGDEAQVAQKAREGLFHY